MKHDVLLVGGSGFIGKTIAQQLQQKGYSVLIPSRRYSAMRDLRLLPSITLVETDINQREEIHKLLALNFLQKLPHCEISQSHFQ
jgi:NADH dehydrogenase